MSKQASTTLIGLFVVGTVVLIVAGMVVFGSGKFFSQKMAYVLFFEESVKGLNIGAPVDFKGVKVGSVTDIAVLFDRKDLSFTIPVTIEIDRSRFAEANGHIDLEKAIRASGTQSVMELLVKQGLRAQLEMQSLVTGLLGVHFDFFPDKPLRLVGRVSQPTELPTIPSSLAAISKTIARLPLDDLVNKLVASIEGIEKFINSPELKDTGTSLNQAVKEAGELLRHIDDQVRPLASGVEQTLGEAQKMFRSVDKEIKPLSAGIQEAVKGATGVFAHVDSQLPKILTTLESTLKATENAIKQAEKTFSGLEDLTGENSSLRYELGNSLKELSNAARSIRVMFDYIERHPEALIQGKGKSEGKGK